MDELTEREKELVAIGASIGSNCIPCVAYHVGKAREMGLTNGQIEAAIVVSEEIRRMPASLVARTARAYLEGESSAATEGPADSDPSGGGCEDSVPGSVPGDSDSSKCGC
jgi:4-carboxymuconolactone decarboxylase